MQKSDSTIGWKGESGNYKNLLLLKAKFLWAENLRKCVKFSTYKISVCRKHNFPTKIVLIRGGQKRVGRFSADLKPNLVFF